MSRSENIWRRDEVERWIFIDERAPVCVSFSHRSSLLICQSCPFRCAEFTSSPLEHAPLQCFDYFLVTEWWMRVWGVELWHWQRANCYEKELTTRSRSHLMQWKRARSARKWEKIEKMVISFSHWRREICRTISDVTQVFSIEKKCCVSAIGFSGRRLAMIFLLPIKFFFFQLCGEDFLLHIFSRRSHNSIGVCSLKLSLARSSSSLAVFLFICGK